MAYEGTPTTAEEAGYAELYERIDAASDEELESELDRLELGIRVAVGLENENDYDIYLRLWIIRARGER